MTQFLKLLIVAAVVLAIDTVAHAQDVLFKLDRPVASHGTVIRNADGGASIEVCGGFERADGGVMFRLCTDRIELTGTARTNALGLLNSAAAGNALRAAAERRIDAENH